jgi:hypothetical protein
VGARQKVANWPVADGSKYEFEIQTPDATWNSVSGVYIFTYFDGKLWRALYVGETEDLSQRLLNHERWPEAKKLGATHIHARVEQLAASRQSLEQKLIQHLRPPLNEQGR